MACDEYIADVCRRFAKAGYLAIAPDLYARQGNAASYTEVSKLMAELVSKVPDGQVMGDLDGAVKWVAANGGDAARVGVTGLLLGWPHHLAVCSPRPGEGGRGLVRAAGGAVHRTSRPSTRWRSRPSSRRPCWASMVKKIPESLLTRLIR